MKSKREVSFVLDCVRFDKERTRRIATEVEQRSGRPPAKQEQSVPKLPKLASQEEKVRSAKPSSRRDKYELRSLDREGVRYMSRNTLLKYM
jgi:hypothetical protein